MSDIKSSPVIALIMAAGRGARMGGAIPKQYLQIAGEPILRHTIKTFINHNDIDIVQLVIHQDDRELYESVTKDLSLPDPVIGGDTRQDSVRIGLEHLVSFKPGKILIHDAARPFVSAPLIADIISGLDKNAAVIPIVTISDTIKHITDKYVTATINRNGLALAQTPQGFDFNTIYLAHKNMRNQSFTDDSSLCEASSVAVATIPSCINNMKITKPEDLEKAEIIWNKNMINETRIGNGFDVHRFEDTTNADNYIMLCGIPVRHNKSVVAHSDGDVGLHALVDALLGSIGAGDIGMHFPPDDPQWHGKDSAHFLTHAVSLIKKAAGHIINIDITLICERPKIGEYREKMRIRIAELLEISTHRISVKATTTEKLGFTGRKEGIAAQASACIQIQRYK